MKYKVSSKLWSYVMGRSNGKVLGEFKSLKEAQDFIKKVHREDEERNAKRMWLTGEYASSLVKESQTKFSCEYSVVGVREPLAKKTFEIVKV